MNDSLARSYLLFQFGAETYGVPVSRVRELVEVGEVTRVPGTPPFVCGVINLRSKVVPIIDLRAKFGMGSTNPGPQPVAIVLEHTSERGVVAVGALVEELLDVVEIPPEQIEARPDYGSSVFGNDYVVGIARVEGAVAFLLDIDRVLALEESRAVAALAVAA